jgi:hypothetical protein
LAANLRTNLQKAAIFTILLNKIYHYSYDFKLFLGFFIRKEAQKRARYESLTPRSFQRMLVLINVMTLRIVATITNTNTHVV